MSARKRRAAWLLLAAAIAALDLWSKDLWSYPHFRWEEVEGHASRFVQDRPILETTIFDSWLAVRTTWNPGAVWSLDIAGTLLLWATGLAIPLVIVWILAPARVRNWETAAKCLILGGAIGNFYDRVQWKAVRDWIDVYFGDVGGWHWPTFNVADMALVGGIGVLLLLSFLPERAE